MPTHPFSDLELARRLERAEALHNSRYVEVKREIYPDSGAEWMEVAGARAMFDGAESPVTQTFALGVMEEASDAALEKIEAFCGARGAPVHHELCPLVDPGLFGRLIDRGHRPSEWSNVLFQAIEPTMRLEGEDPGMTVRAAESDEVELWTDVATRGWSDFGNLRALLREAGRIGLRREDSTLMLVEQDGKAIAAGALVVQGGVAALAGAATVPEARRRGAQNALLGARLRHGASQGAELAMMVTAVGSGSQRNAERHGFRIAYTRSKWSRPAS